MDRIPRSRAEFDRLCFMDQCKIKERLLNKNFVLFCDRLGLDHLPRFKDVVHKGDYEELELSRERHNKSRVVQKLLMDLPRSMKKNPSWFGVLDQVAWDTAPEMYYALNPWERRHDGGGAGGGGGGWGGGGDGGPRPPRPPRGSTPYSKSTPLSQTRGIVPLLKGLCEGPLWRDLAEDGLGLTVGEVMEIERQQERGIPRVLIETVIKHHEDAATIHMLLQALFNLGEEGRAVVGDMEQRGLIPNQGREGCEAGGESGDACDPFCDHLEAGATSTLATQPPTPRVPPHGSPPPAACPPPQQPGSSGYPGPRSDVPVSQMLQRSTSAVSAREVNQANIPPHSVNRAASLPATMQSTASLGFTPSQSGAFVSSSPPKLEKEMMDNLDSLSLSSMEDNDNQCKTAKEIDVEEEKRLNTGQPPSSPTEISSGQPTSVLRSSSLQNDAPSSGLAFPQPSAAVADHSSPDPMHATASTSSSATTQPNLPTTHLGESVPDVIRQSQEDITSILLEESFERGARNSREMPEEGRTRPAETAQPATSVGDVEGNQTAVSRQQGGVCSEEKGTDMDGMTSPAQISRMPTGGNGPVVNIKIFGRVGCLQVGDTNTVQDYSASPPASPVGSVTSSAAGLSRSNSCGTTIASSNSEATISASSNNTATAITTTVSAVSTPTTPSNSTTSTPTPTNTNTPNNSNTRANSDDQESNHDLPTPTEASDHSNGGGVPAGSPPSYADVLREGPQYPNQLYGGYTYTASPHLGYMPAPHHGELPFHSQSGFTPSHPSTLRPDFPFTPQAQSAEWDRSTRGGGMSQLVSAPRSAFATTAGPEHGDVSEEEPAEEESLESPLFDPRRDVECHETRVKQPLTEECEEPCPSPQGPVASRLEEQSGEQSEQHHQQQHQQLQRQQLTQNAGYEDEPSEEVLYSQSLPQRGFDLQGPRSLDSQTERDNQVPDLGALLSIDDAVEVRLTSNQSEVFMDHPPSFTDSESSSPSVNLHGHGSDVSHSGQSPLRLQLRSEGHQLQSAVPQELNSYQSVDLDQIHGLDRARNAVTQDQLDECNERSSRQPSDSLPNDVDLEEASDGAIAGDTLMGQEEEEEEEAEEEEEEDGDDEQHQQQSAVGSNEPASLTTQFAQDETEGDRREGEGRERSGGRSLRQRMMASAARAFFDTVFK